MVSSSPDASPTEIMCVIMGGNSPLWRSGPAIDAPEFVAVSLALAEGSAAKRLGSEEPVIGLVVNGEARA